MTDERKEELRKQEGQSMKYNELMKKKPAT
jgi:hypothetical protein